jgi:putative nucleotidyltransferase with HDIG domain
LQKGKKDRSLPSAVRNPVYQGYAVGLAVILGLSGLLLQPPFSVLKFLGLASLVTVLTGILYLDIRRYRSAMSADPGKLALLGLLLVGTIAVDRFLILILRSYVGDLSHVDPSAIYFALPTASGAMLATLLLDTHMGLTVAFVLSLLIGIVNPDQSFLTIYSFVGGVAAAFSVLYSRRRTHILKAAGIVMLANVLMIVALDLYRGSASDTTRLYDVLFGVGGGLLVGLLVSAVLPMLESFFKIPTNIRLLELLDNNQPLLKRLKAEAPGTYYHSMMVSNAAEAAAEAIGENPMFARVCCYYHDIGKMIKPEYYIENQTEPENRHDRLNPHLSSMVVISHVKEGIELARRYHLPESIIDMIPQHHGTRVVNYFYSKARKASNPSLPPVDEQEFRYPGPKPQSKTAAIIMLADAVEASSRVLPDSSPQRISGLVDEIVAHIYLDGQLDESDLTMKDLKKIQDSFKTVLTRQRHRRIDYPGMGPDPNRKAKNGNPDQVASEKNGNGQGLKDASRKDPAKTGAA